MPSKTDGKNQNDEAAFSRWRSYVLFHDQTHNSWHLYSPDSAAPIAAAPIPFFRRGTEELDPSRCSVEDSVAYLRKCFSKFRVALLRRSGRSVSYIAVVELQESGMAHLHVLISVYTEQAWISKAWQAVGGGKIVDIRFVDVHRVTAYVAKYLTKDHLLLVPAKKKRISTCRDIRLFDKRNPSGWTWSPDHIEKIFFRLSHSRTISVSDVIRDDGGVKTFLAIHIGGGRHE